MLRFKQSLQEQTVFQEQPKQQSGLGTTKAVQKPLWFATEVKQSFTHTTQADTLPERMYEK